MTAGLPDPDQVFAEALAADAGQLAEPAAPAPAPPKKSDNPDAPHGYEADGVTPRAPYGHKPDGRPRIKPGGPGRAAQRSKDDRPRTVTTRPDTAVSRETPKDAGPDYSADLTDLGMSVWLAGSALRGGRLFFLPVPDTRPYAAVWKQQLPTLVAAWNVGARQNATVRGYVEKLSGEGSWSWVLGCSVATLGLVAACTEMARADPKLRAAAAAANDAELEEFISAQIAELGLTADPGAGPDQAAAA